MGCGKCRTCQHKSLGICGRRLHRGGADAQVAPVSRLISGYLSTLRRPNALLGAASSPLPSSCRSSEDAATCPCLTAGPNSLLSASDSLFRGAAVACCCPCQPDGPATAVLETGWPAAAMLPSAACPGPTATAAAWRLRDRVTGGSGAHCWACVARCCGCGRLLTACCKGRTRSRRRPAHGQEWRAEKCAKG